MPRLTPRVLRRSAVTLTALAVAAVPSLTSSASALTLRGSAKSYSLSYNADHSRVRWNPCKAIHYRVNVARGPKTALSEVQSAVWRMSTATGMTFVYDGPTAVMPMKNYGSTSTSVWAPPLVFAWATPGTGAGQSSLLSATTTGEMGVGGYRTYWWSEGTVMHKNRIVTGFVVLNTASNRLPYGFVTGPSRGEALLHELAHAVGLNHVNDRTQIMNPVLGPYATWGAGDTAGLQMVGRPAGCIS